METTQERNYKLELALKLSPLTYEQVCYLAKIHQSTLYRMLNKGNKTRPHIIESLCTVLGKSPKELGLDYYYDS